MTVADPPSGAFRAGEFAATAAAAIRRRDHRRTLRAIAIIIAILLFAITTPFAVKYAVKWAITDMGGYPAGANGTNGSNGLDGNPGTRGLPGSEGASGLPGSEGSDGAPGRDGMTGAQGPAGQTGPQGPQGDSTPISIGNGAGTVEACDSDITIRLRSDYIGGELILGRIIIDDLSDACNGQSLALYLIDNDDSVLTVLETGPVTVSDNSLTLLAEQYPVLHTIASRDLNQIIIEMAY